MTPDQMAGVLRDIAQLLELKGENPFKIRAYNTGADAVRNFPGDIVARAKANDLAGIKGLGDALRDKLHELATTGRLEFFEKLRAEYPEGILELFSVSGLGAKKIKALHEALGVGSIADLKKVCENGEAAKLPGFGAKTAEKILQGISFQSAHASEFRQEQVAPFVASILEMLKQHPDVSRAEVAGSYRRGKETVHDLDFIAATRFPKELMEDFVKMPGVQQVLGHGDTKSSVLLESGVQCDLRAVTNEQFACALVYFTGSKEHNIVLRSRALERGWSLNEYAFTPAPKSRHTESPVCMEEKDVYEMVGLKFIEPELRENNGEIEAAEHGTLPRLVELSNLRGVFHNHTTATDGKNTLREMADAAQELGWQYLGIADHSKSSPQAAGLSAEMLLAQVAEIRELNKEYDPAKFRVFAGNEVDILKDGVLDFDEDILSQLDFTVGSVHSLFSLPEDEMTKRIIRAIESPYITMLGHLTGRLLLQRASYGVNIPAVIEAAAATGTIIEINANPRRLDMDWRWWKLAKEKGVKTSINPDAHTTRGLQDVFYGVRTARKGWLTREDVINTLPLDKVESAIHAKRKKHGITVPE